MPSSPAVVGLKSRTRSMNTHPWTTVSSISQEVVSPLRAAHPDLVSVPSIHDKGCDSNRRYAHRNREYPSRKELGEDSSGEERDQ